MSTTPFPSSIGRYAVLDRVGRGGMGVVYRANDPHIGRTVAIKVLHVADDALRARFLKEVQFLGTLNHPNIVTIYDCGEQGEQPFIVMEYIDGVTLAEYVHDRTPPSVSTKIKLLRELCSALDYAHQRGIIHRDIKPANLMVDRDGVLKVLDFGVARIGEAQATQSGTVVGTVNYMSPEQIEGRAVDKRSDIFSVGLVIYEVFALRQAFSNDGKTMWQMMQAVLREQPAALSAVCPNLDPDVERIVNRAIDKNPSGRYQTLALLSRDLAKVESKLPTAESMQEATVLLRVATPPPLPQALKTPPPESASDPPPGPKTEDVPSTEMPSEGAPIAKTPSEAASSDKVVIEKPPSQVVPSAAVVPSSPDPPGESATPATSSSTVVPVALSKFVPAWAGRFTSARQLLPLAGLLALAAGLLVIMRLGSPFGSGRPEQTSPAGGGQKVEPVTSAPSEQKPGREPGTQRPQETGGPQPRRSLYEQAVGYMPTPSNPNNPAKAADLFQQACDGGDLRGCSDLAQMLEAAHLLAQDVPRAATLYQRACDGGAGAACNSLGNMYREARGVTKDEEKAAALYQRACDSGIGVACANLGRAYVEGLGVDKDLFRARSLLQSACDAGSAAGCNDLGVLYVRGEGGDRDESRAVQFFQRACDGGWANGCYGLGQAYSNGGRVPRDVQLALSNFERACDLGLTAGCERLAQLQRGRGGRRDLAGVDGRGAGRRAAQRALRDEDRPLQVGTAPAKIKDVRPVYPPAAVVARIQGVVVIEATIDASGKVVATRVLRSIRSLDEAAERAVMQWEFAPTVINGVARTVVTTVTVPFSLP